MASTELTVKLILDDDTQEQIRRIVREEIAAQSGRPEVISPRASLEGMAVVRTKDPYIVSIDPKVEAETNQAIRRAISELGSDAIEYKEQSLYL